MTRELSHIIQNKRFKTTWGDYLCLWEFVIPMLILIYGLELTGKARAPQDYFIGPLLVIVAFLLTRFMLRRIIQLNNFEEINNALTQAENFEIVLKRLKTLNVIEVDRDVNNCTINAKYKSNLIPPVFEWLTIVCLNNRVLVNSRPTPVTIVFWVRRNAMIAFKKT